MSGCKTCGKSYVTYDTWACCWRAGCDLLGTAQNISEYTEDEENVPDVDFDLGRSDSYCEHHVDGAGEASGK